MFLLENNQYSIDKAVNNLFLYMKYCECQIAIFSITNKKAALYGKVWNSNKLCYLDENRLKICASHCSNLLNPNINVKVIRRTSLWVLSTVLA